jgi:hypothetical protein
VAGYHKAAQRAQVDQAARLLRETQRAGGVEQRVVEREPVLWWREVNPRWLRRKK